MARSGLNLVLNERGPWESTGQREGSTNKEEEEEDVFLQQSARARILMFGIPFHEDNKAYLDRVISDLDIVTKYCFSRNIDLDPYSIFDGRPKKEEILIRIRQFLNNSSSTSKSAHKSIPRLIIFAGHGRDHSGDWMCADADLTFDEVYGEIFSSYSKLISEAENNVFQGGIKEYPQTMLLCDCCYSGVWAGKFFEKIKTNSNGNFLEKNIENVMAQKFVFQSSCGVNENAYDGVFLSAWCFVQRKDMDSEYALRHFYYLKKHPIFVSSYPAQIEVFSVLGLDALKQGGMQMFNEVRKAQTDYDMIISNTKIDKITDKNKTTTSMIDDAFSQKKRQQNKTFFHDVFKFKDNPGMKEVIDFVLDPQKVEKIEMEKDVEFIKLESKIILALCNWAPRTSSESAMWDEGIAFLASFIKKKFANKDILMDNRETLFLYFIASPLKSRRDNLKVKMVLELVCILFDRFQFDSTIMFPQFLDEQAFLKPLTDCNINLKNESVHKLQLYVLWNTCRVEKAVVGALKTGVLKKVLYEEDDFRFTQNAQDVVSWTTKVLWLLLKVGMEKVVKHTRTAKVEEEKRALRLLFRRQAYTVEDFLNVQEENRFAAEALKLLEQTEE